MLCCLFLKTVNIFSVIPLPFLPHHTHPKQVVLGHPTIPFLVPTCRSWSHHKGIQLYRTFEKVQWDNICDNPSMVSGDGLVSQEYFSPLAGQSTIIYQMPLKYWGLCCPWGSTGSPKDLCFCSHSLSVYNGPLLQVEGNPRSELNRDSSSPSSSFFIKTATSKRKTTTLPSRRSS